MMQGIIEVPWVRPVLDNTGKRVILNNIPVVGPCTMYAVILPNSDTADMYHTIEEARKALIVPRSGVDFTT